MTSVTLGELDRAMAAYRHAEKKNPGRPARWVLEALKSFEKDRGLNVRKKRYMSKQQFDRLMKAGEELRKEFQRTTAEVKRITAEQLRFRVD